MAELPVGITIRFHTSGYMQAFADLTMMTEYGEITIRGCRIMKVLGKPEWVGFPSTSYNQNGQTRYKELFDMSQTTRRKLAEAILAACRGARESQS